MICLFRFAQLAQLAGKHRIGEAGKQADSAAHFERSCQSSRPGIVSRYRQTQGRCTVSSTKSTVIDCCSILVAECNKIVSRFTTALFLYLELISIRCGRIESRLPCDQTWFLLLDKHICVDPVA